MPSTTTPEAGGAETELALFLPRFDPREEPTGPPGQEDATRVIPATVPPAHPGEPGPAAAESLAPEGVSEPRAALHQTGLAARALSQRVQRALRRLGPGTPLPQGPRAFLERILGHPLDKVRLHAETEAATITGDIGAAAATLGSHIILSPTRSNLQTPQGLTTLAHEAVHAIQRTTSGPAWEGAPEARQEESTALRAEEMVRRLFPNPVPPEITFPPSGALLPRPPLPLWRREGLPAGRSIGPEGDLPIGKEASWGSIASGSPPPRAVPATPSAGPLQRAVAGETPTPAPAPAEDEVSAAPDLEALTEEVYRRILYRLRLEREWRGL